MGRVTYQLVRVVIYQGGITALEASLLQTVSSTWVSGKMEYETGMELNHIKTTERTE